MSSVVEMEQKYPFGQYRGTSQTLSEALVLKRLTYGHVSQKEIINKMINLMKSLDNQHLIQIQNSYTEGEHQFLIYYQYVPLSLQRWILDVGDQLVDQLQFQMVSLANYLTHQNIKFHFDDTCIGLNKDMKVKYFLQEFMVDPEKKMENFKMVEGEIGRFFKTFKESREKSQQSQAQFKERLSVDTVMLPNHSIVKNDRSSWQIGTKKVTIDKINKKNLSEKIQFSKRKSMQVLMKLKGLKLKPQES